MANQHYRSPFGGTMHTKVFVGGLAWETPTDVMRRYFEQFGEILEAVVITDKSTGKSKGYGFVTFRDPESARRACADPNPVIDGRRANCNIASLGRPRPSPPPGRNQGGSYQVGAVPLEASSSYSGVVAGAALPPLPPPPPIVYPPYGYTTYSPNYGYHQGIYNPQLHRPQYYHNLYGTSSSAIMRSPYYYGFSTQASSTSATLSSAPQTQHFHGQPLLPLPPPPPSYLFYRPPTQTEGGSFSNPPPPPLPQFQSPRHSNLSSATDSQAPQETSTETEVGAARTSESQN